MSYPSDWQTLPPEACTVEVPRQALHEVDKIACAIRNASRAEIDVGEIGGRHFIFARLSLWCARKLLFAGAASYSLRLERQQHEVPMFTRFFTLLAVLFIPVVALAQAVAASLPVELTVDEALKQGLPIIVSMKGASALAIAVAVTQLIMKLAQSPLGNLAGKYKLLIVTGVSIVATYLGLVVAGTSWLSALIAGPLLAAVQVFAHQMISTLKPPTPPAGQ